MVPVIDFLAEEELKTAEQIVMQIFEVKQARQMRSGMSPTDARKARRKGKHARDCKASCQLASEGSRCRTVTTKLPTSFQNQAERGQ